MYEERQYKYPKLNEILDNIGFVLLTIGIAGQVLLVLYLIITLIKC